MTASTLPHSAGRLGSAAPNPSLVLAAIALLTLAACMQTDPGSPVDTTPVVPEDNGRRAGASSSTNWPTEYTGGTFHKVFWIADRGLKLPFFDMPATFPPVDLRVKRSGRVQLFLSGAIPALDSLEPVSWPFEETDTLVIPKEKIEMLGNPADDTIQFNIRIENDSLGAWLQGFIYSRKEGRILPSESTALPENPAYMKPQNYYFKGYGPDVAAMLPPPQGSNSVLSFYIPGTPVFCKAQPDSFMVGPLAMGNFPLRMMRLSSTGESADSTLVEAWELRAEKVGGKTVFKLGDQVLAFQSRGKLALRNDK